jgi:hypothetical protein
VFRDGWLRGWKVRCEFENGMLFAVQDQVKDTSSACFRDCIENIGGCGRARHFYHGLIVEDCDFAVCLMAILSRTGITMTERESRRHR